MKDVEYLVLPVKTWTMREIHRLRDSVDMDPVYQRLSDAWSTFQKGHFIDSIANGFVLPPIYLHELGPTKDRNDQSNRYAVIDGKQRLSAVWAFFDNEVSLPRSSRFLRDLDAHGANKTYSRLDGREQRIRDAFESGTMPVVVVRSTSIELIFEMFQRLNLPTRLNPAEFRNAMLGPIPPAIRELSWDHPFFFDCLPFENARLKHFDLAAKFLYMEHKGGPATLRKSEIDGFVRQFIKEKLEERKEAQAEAQGLVSETRATLEMMSKVFEAGDPLLRASGLVSLYYLVFLACRNGKASTRILSRRAFAAFTELREIWKELSVDSDEYTPGMAKMARFEHNMRRNEGPSFAEKQAVLLDFLNAFHGGVQPGDFLQLGKTTQAKL